MNIEHYIVGLLLAVVIYIFVLKSCSRLSITDGFTQLRVDLNDLKKNNNDNILDFISNIKIRPECCKSHPYSTSNGCACFSSSQINFLNNRGGNNSL